MAPGSPHPSGNIPDWSEAMRRADFPAAFAASDAVLRSRDPAGRDDPARPYHERWVWDGRDLAGQDVLVRCYHGLGDTLQFCRYLPALGRIAARVTLEVQPELLGLLRQVDGVDRLHGFDPAHPLKPAARDVEIMELAHALRLPPDPRPYLRADPLPGPPGRVGFCWSGGGWDRGRDVPPKLLVPLLAPLLRRPGLHPISLQRGPGVAEMERLGVALPDPLQGSMDLEAMAGLLAGLDAVVTVDTMIAHLAGALGRPVLLLLKHQPDWRWSRPGTWYGSVRHFTQDSAGDWHAPLTHLAQVLDEGLEGTIDAPTGL